MKKERDITSFRHVTARANNPDVGVLDSENNPSEQSANWKYDPHLDPSLSWAGKEEKEDFDVDTVPLHVNERVDPLSVIASALKQKEGKVQGDLFHNSFENLPLDKALEFYQHDKNWANRIIAGDSLLIMNSLLLKEKMKEKIQMIYFDPPYGINYGSNFQPFSSKKPVVGEDKDENLSSEPEMIKAFRDTWEFKIHSYLSYLRDRIMLGRELLNEKGSMFVQISDENLHYVRTIMSEIFGEKNYCAIIPFRKRQGRTGASKLPEQTHDFIVWYSKNKESMKYNQLWLDKPMTRKLHYYHGDKKVTLNDKQQNEFRNAFSSQNSRNVSFVEDTSEIFEHVPLGKTHTSKKNIFDLDYMGDKYPSPKHGWATSRENLDRLARLDRLVPLQASVEFKRYCMEGSKTRLTSIWSDTTGVTGAKYVVQTNDLPIQRCILMTTDPGDIVLDPTCGSGTTAFVAEKWGRRWITCDTSRVATTLAKSRLMTSVFDYWTLASPEGGIEGGFEYEEMMEVTASIIEKNEEVDEIYKLMYPKVSQALSVLNEVLKSYPPSSVIPHRGKRKGTQIDFKNGEFFEEWEVPGTAPDDWPIDAKEALVKFQSERQQMINTINFSIRENARKHTLYDRPTVDLSKLRVSGPFTLESVPAPIVSRADGASEDEAVHRDCWRSELEKTGIREIGGKILGVEHIEEMQGTKYLHAVGRLEGGGRLIASFCAKYATLDRLHVSSAVNEAKSIRPKPDILAFCAFAIEGDVADYCKEREWDGVSIILVQMNADLLTDDLKKRQPSSESFWLVGQPDVEVRRQKDRWIVELNGFDYFDPIEGKLISGGTDQIAMWCLDTNFDGRSVMPDQVFFPNDDRNGGWKKLTAAARDVLDEDLMERFHGTVSLPFDAEDQQVIAVKVIDNRGIESMKIVHLEDTQ